MEFIRKNGMQRLAQGVYADSDAWIDDMFVLSLRTKNAVFSHESALLLHGLTEREPAKLAVTLPSGYNAATLRRDGVHVYYIKPKLMTLGRIELLTPDGNLVAESVGVVAVGPGRATADAFSSCSGLAINRLLGFYPIQLEKASSPSVGISVQTAFHIMHLCHLQVYFRNSAHPNFF
jgi:hypothetical protein